METISTALQVVQIVLFATFLFNIGRLILSLTYKNK
jgi:hypothetical protein